MEGEDTPPPPPPPHGKNPRSAGGGLPDGNYDIFIIPPHSSGGGFLYLPSLQPHRNSFLLGVASTLLVLGIWKLVEPPLKQALNGLATNGASGGVMVVVCIAVGVGAWAIGKTQAEGGNGESRGDRSGGQGAQQGQRTNHRQGQSQSQEHDFPRGNAHEWAPPPPPPPPPPPQPEPGPQERPQTPPPPPEPEPQAKSPPPQSPPKPKPSDAQSSWEKARAETRKREEERKRAEELRKKRDEMQRAREEAQRKREEAERALQAEKEEAERQAKAKAEKEKWEQMRAREKEQREKDARERIAREKAEREREAKEKEAKEREAKQKAEREKEARQRAVREKLEKIKAEREREKAAKSEAGVGGARANAQSATPTVPSPTKSESGVKASSYVRPTAKSSTAATSVIDENTHSYRPYDIPKSRQAPTYKTSASSISGLSESSYAPSHSTARTTPPPSHRGPYSTKDPGKVQIKGVYLFTDSWPNKPIDQLESNSGNVTDGLILRIESEGLFIDDDVRGVPQREWDVKAWTLKLIEDGKTAAGVGGVTAGIHVLRATVRDVENKKYTFILDESEAWKVALGLQKLRKGSQVRSMGMNGIKEREVNGLLSNLGWL